MSKELFTGNAMNEEGLPHFMPHELSFLPNHASSPLLGSQIAIRQMQSSRSGFHQTWISSRYPGTDRLGKRRIRNSGVILADSSMQASQVEIISLTDSWVAVNKPPGMLVHRTKLYHSNPNETYVVDHVSQLVSQRTGFPVTVKPIQRLDRPTSGVMLFALGDSASAARLQAALQSPDTQKVYWALVSGADMPERWVNEHSLTDLTGKHRKKRSARTEIHQLARLNASNVSVVSARIRTGRRHQIRRHLSNSRHPILGDTSYGKGETNRIARERFGITRCCLHAWCLIFQDPVTNQTVHIEVAIPEDLRKVLQRFPDIDSGDLEWKWNVK